VIGSFIEAIYLSKNQINPLIPIIVGLIIGVIILPNIWQAEKLNQNFDELALGDNTIIDAIVDNRKVHCLSLNNSDRCFRDYHNHATKNEVVLWLGNSQLHSINQLKDDDKLSSAILHKRLINQNRYVLTFSQPNANLQEHYILFEYLLKQLPISTIILPVVFDDLRETGIRSDLRRLFEVTQVTDSLQKSEIGELLLSSKNNNEIADNNALDGTQQLDVERYLNDFLANNWKVWSQRAQYRGNLFNDLYILRNWVFGITPSSVRKVIPGRYAMNMSALKAIVNSSKEKKIQILLYIPPLRNDVAIPYDHQKYKNFKSEVMAIASNEYTNFVDIDSIVPAEFWGLKAATTVGGNQELDFMHFKGTGHNLLANRIYEELQKLWMESKE
jgi:hypothetical protein